MASSCIYRNFELKLLHHQTFESVDAAYLFAFHKHHMHTFMHTNQKKLTFFLAHPEDEDSRRGSLKNHGKVEHGDAICKESLDHTQGKVDMILELFLDSITMNFSDQVVIGKQTENGLNMDKI